MVSAANAGTKQCLATLNRIGLPPGARRSACAAHGLQCATHTRLSRLSSTWCVAPRRAGRGFRHPCAQRACRGALPSAVPARQKAAGSSASGSLPRMASCLAHLTLAVQPMPCAPQHTVEVKKDGVAELALDTRDVAVSSVTVNGEGEGPRGRPCCAAPTLGGSLTCRAWRRLARQRAPRSGCHGPTRPKGDEGLRPWSPWLPAACAHAPNPRSRGVQPGRAPQGAGQPPGSQPACWPQGGG